MTSNYAYGRSSRVNTSALKCSMQTRGFDRLLTIAPARSWPQVWPMVQWSFTVQSESYVLFKQNKSLFRKFSTEHTLKDRKRPIHELKYSPDKSSHFLAVW